MFVGARDFLVGLMALLVGVLREVLGIVLAGVVLLRVDLWLIDGLKVLVALPFPLSVVVVWRSFFVAIGLTVGTGGFYKSISIYYNVYYKYKNL